MNIFKKTSVEQIHAEFDLAEEKTLNECDRILKELSIPTETAIERKANMLEELGFINSEAVKQSSTIKERKKLIEEKINISKLQSDINEMQHFKKLKPD